MAYGDWMRTHIHAQQSKVVMGSLSRSIGRTRSSEPSVHTPTASVTEGTSAKAISIGTEKCNMKSAEGKDMAHLVVEDLVQTGSGNLGNAKGKEIY